MKKEILRNISVAAAVIAAAACGTTVKVGTDNPKQRIPTQQEADSLVIALAGGAQGRSIAIVEGEKVIGLVPNADSAKVRCVTIVDQKGTWTVTDSFSMPCGDENGLPFTGLTDSVCVRQLGADRYITYSEQRGDGASVQRTVVAYSPATLAINTVTFNGRAVKDGKFKGTSNKNVLTGTDRPEMAWIIQRLESYPDLMFQSEGEIMSEQAIEWWLSKNPKALTSSTKITFGQLPAESSLAALYEKAKKEKGDKFYAAQVDTDEYAMVIAKNRSTGQYVLAWVEPQCRNKKTDRLLNSIYFSTGSYLTMFYYKGKTTFTYRLNLANGTLQR